MGDNAGCTSIYFLTSQDIFSSDDAFLPQSQPHLSPKAPRFLGPRGPLGTWNTCARPFARAKNPDQPYKSYQDHVRPLMHCQKDNNVFCLSVKTNTKTKTKKQEIERTMCRTKTKSKWMRDPKYAIFLEKHILNSKTINCFLVNQTRVDHDRPEQTPRPSRERFQPNLVQFLRQRHMKEVVGMFTAWQEQNALVSDKNMSSSNLFVSNNIGVIIIFIIVIQNFLKPDLFPI